MRTVIIKLGGAAITDKSVADALSPHLDNLVDRVARVYKEQFRPNGVQLILVHGAGSFGHPPAKKHKVKAGWVAGAPSEQVTETEKADRQRREDNVKFGMALTRQRMIQLHHHVLQRLQDQSQLPVLSVSTYDTVETDQGELTQESSVRLLTRVQHLLSQGFIPLLFGDAVFDQSKGSTILSGDALMHKLATELREVYQCVFITDVAGIFTKDPKRHSDATLIRQLRCSTEHGIDENETSASVDDVTGGMSSKWQWIKRIMADASQMTNVIICQVSDSERALGTICQGLEEGDHFDESCAWTTIYH